jgi:hypothetical protein
LSRITIQETTVSTVTKGKNSYQVAEVTFTTDRGENKTKKVMSFSNPGVFAIVSKISHPTPFEAENDGAPYYNWTKLTPAVEDSPKAPGAQPSGGRVVGSTYETAEERKIKQLLIVRQSSITNALSYLNMVSDREGQQFVPKEDVIEIAQFFVDYVYGTDETLEALDRDNQRISEE